MFLSDVGVFSLQYVLGQSGVMLMLVIIFMAVTSAGSAEMMAVSSLFTYDVWKVSTCLHMRAQACTCLCIQQEVLIRLQRASSACAKQGAS